MKIRVRLLKSGTRIENRPRRATDALVRGWTFEAIATGKLFSLARDPFGSDIPGKRPQFPRNEVLGVPAFVGTRWCSGRRVVHDRLFAQGCRIPTR